MTNTKRKRDAGSEEEEETRNAITLCVREATDVRGARVEWYAMV